MPLFFIIWGSRARESTAEQGEFYCPHCRADAGYDLVKVSNYFTLFFIPLFPIGTLGEYVRCDGCDSQLDASVLDYTREEIEAHLQPWKCSNCGNQNPPDHRACLSCQTPRHQNEDDVEFVE